MALNVPLLRSSFQLVTKRDPDVVKHFYDVLFARYPQVRPLFKSANAATQHLKLGKALGDVLENIEDAGWLQRELGAMGRRHDGYGVTAEMYPWVGECLLAVMQDAAGEDWTPEIADAWTQAYGAIQSLMLAR